jgi:HK97 family phage major capsid protein
MTREEIEQAIAEYKSDLALPAHLIEKHKALNEVRTGFKAWWDSKKTANPDVLKLEIPEFERRNGELEAKDTEFRNEVTPFIKAAKNERLLKLSAAMGRPVNSWSFGEGQTGEGAKSLVEALNGNDEFKSFRETGSNSAQLRVNLKGLDVKTLFSTTAGFAPPANRGDMIVEAPRRRPVIADYIPQTPTDLQFIVWMLQTVFTNAAAPVAQAGAKPESALAWTEQKDQLEKIAHYIPITMEVLKYNPRLAQLLDSEMMTMLRLIAEVQIVSGTGTSPQLKGFLTRPGLSVYVRDEEENNADAIYKSMAQVRNDAYAEPGVVFINPDNMTPIALMKNTQGDYIYGNPSQGGPQSIWGKPAVQTKAIPATNSLTGDFEMYSELFLGGEMNVEFGYINDDFIKNRRVALAELFLLLIVKRASAFSNAQGLE